VPCRRWTPDLCGNRPPLTEPDVRAALAGLRSFGSPQGSTLFEHREARWLLSVHWMETPAVVEEIAA
ncbi:MAG: hypothetical protein QMB75_06655, partial [Thauera sp.]